MPKDRTIPPRGQRERNEPERDWLTDHTWRLIDRVEQQCARLRRSMRLPDGPGGPHPTEPAGDPPPPLPRPELLVESQGVRQRAISQRSRLLRERAAELCRIALGYRVAADRMRNI